MRIADSAAHSQPQPASPSRWSVPLAPEIALLDGGPRTASATTECPVASCAIYDFDTGKDSAIVSYNVELTG